MTTVLQSKERDLSPQQDRVASLMAAGCTPAQISSATGFSLGYISQLGGLAKFKEKVVEKSGDRLERDIRVQDRYDSVEDMLLVGIKERAGTADMSELSRALDVVAKNNPKKKALGGGVGDGRNGESSVSITLNLPEYIREPLDIKTNARNEVIEIGEQSMIPLTAKEIRGRLQGIES